MGKAQQAQALYMILKLTVLVSRPVGSFTRNILLKGEYVTQNYDGYLNTGSNNRFYEGKFDGFVIPGAISF